MRVVALPGVFAPISDSRLLADCAEAHAVGARVLEPCCGSGYVAARLARAGARAVTATDVSRRAVLSTRLTARRNGVRVRALRGHLLEPVRDERFDLIVVNPPYVPAVDARTPRGAARAWDAGRDGRALLDRVVREAPPRLAVGGVLFVVHSSLLGERRTLEALARAGLAPWVAARQCGPLGPLMSARAGELERRGLLAPGLREEEVLVVAGAR